jgi:hypothetical protein
VPSRIVSPVSAVVAPPQDRLKTVPLENIWPWREPGRSSTAQISAKYEHGARRHAYSKHKQMSDITPCCDLYH